MRLRVPNFVLAAAGVLCIAAIPSAGSAQGDALPEGPGKAELSKACTLCHGVDQISAQRKTPEEWSGTVERMVGFGATLSEPEHAAVLAYLNTNFGKGGAPTTTAAAPADPAAAAPATDTPKPN